MLTTIEQFPLHRNKVLKRFVTGMFGWFFLSLLLAYALMSVMHFDISITLLVILIFLIILGAWQWFYENKYFESYFYDADADFLKIRKDWITPRETIIPYEKLQDVYMDQDLFDRLFGLWDVHVSTATVMSGMEAHIDGIDHENANRIRALLLEKITGKKHKVTGYD